MMKYPIGTRFKYIGVNLPFAGRNWECTLVKSIGFKNDYIQVLGPTDDFRYNYSVFPLCELELLSDKFEIAALTIEHDKVL